MSAIRIPAALGSGGGAVGCTRNHLASHFGSNAELTAVTVADAESFEDYLRGKGLSRATVSREIKRARQFFQVAVKKRLISENPFKDIQTPAQVNRSRAFFVTREMTDKVMLQCPDAEWKLILALSRFAGDDKI